MPYVSKERRDLLAYLPPETAGDLNYLVTKMCVAYLGTAFTYTRLNEVIGVLACAQAELYRRVAAPYEQQKEHENGDVYR